MLENKLVNSWVCVVGEPNAGKSTLFNALLGKKLSITTPKAQTTRNSLKGIQTEETSQIVYIDTPGFLDVKKNIDKYMARAITESIPDADVILLIHDSTKNISEREQNFLQNIQKNQAKKILVLNKIDKINKIDLLAKTESFKKMHNFSEVFMISALKKQGLLELKQFLHKNASSPGWHFNKEDETTAPFTFYVQEIIREKILLNTHKEIPYNVLIKTEFLEELDHLLKAYVTIYVPSESQKKIILGEDGNLIKRISTQARIELERAINKKIFLRTHIKVKSWDKLISDQNFINY